MVGGVILNYYYHEGLGAAVLFMPVHIVNQKNF